MSEMTLEAMVAERIEGNAEVLEKLYQAETSDEVKYVFSSIDIEIDDAAARGFMESMHGAEQPSELEEEALEAVSGGLIGAVIIGLAIGKAVGVNARRAYDKIKYGDASRTYKKSWP